EVAAREGLTLATDKLLHWAHWITPEALPMRFDTHFFFTPMPQGQEAAHDQLETTAGGLVTAGRAGAGFEQGGFPIVFATIHQLRDLTGLVTVASARERLAGTAPRTLRPRVIRRRGVDTIVLSSDDEQDEE